jgi:thymidylate synthase
MKQIKDLFSHVLEHGVLKKNRTGMDTLAVFGYQMRFNLQDGFPIVTGKMTPFRLVASELLWFIQGKQHQAGAIKYLHAHNNHIWDEWVKPDGSFGPIYGVQWRNWIGVDAEGESVHVDQLKRAIELLVSDPDSRRNIVTAWQPAELRQMALAPCHILFQLNTRPGPGDSRYVDLQLYQRSCDCFLGVPFNVASYALLMHIICHIAGSQFLVGDLVWTGGDVHLYVNHLDQARAYLERDLHPLPTLVLPNYEINLDDLHMEHFTLEGYRHSGALKGEVSV